MKITIRRKVFETNSSSTHSLSYTSDTPDEYSFKCDSAWSRLLILKGLINQASLYGGEEYDEEYDEDTTQGEDLSEEIDNEEEYFDNSLDYKEKVYDFFEACLKVFSAKEGVSIDDVPDYLGGKLLAEYKKDPCAFADEEFMKYFKEAYDEKGDHLCSFLFEEGCLDECDCGYGRFGALANYVVPNSPFEQGAEEYLYGDKAFCGEEYYAGCKFIASKLKY